MMPATNQGVGQNMGAPDPCSTPPLGIPIPYPNIGMDSTALPVIPNVMFSSLPAQNMTCKPAMTNGDNAGVWSPCMGPGGLTVGDPIVQVNGMGAAHLTLPSYGNNYVCAAGVKAVPSVTNVLICWRAPAAACWTPAALRRLPSLLREPLGGVSWRLTPTRLGVVRVERFGLTTPAALTSALSELKTRRPKALVVDLRGNSGGALTAALAAVRILSSAANELRLVVLQDAATASSAEVCAATLQDLDRAVIVGERSFGKGRAALASLGPEGATLSSPLGDVRRWGGAPLQDVGVEPDRAVPTREAMGEAEDLL